jgi:hypothetical protein
MKSFIAKLRINYRNLRYRLKDPTKHCEYYKTYGCSHVDGLLCPCEQMDRSCNNCAKRQSIDCPNSSLCYSTREKPYFESRK